MTTTRDPVPGRSAATFDTTAPATGAVVGTFEVMDAARIAAVTARARDGFVWWSALGTRHRQWALLAWAATIWDRCDELVATVHAENGKPEDDAVLEIVMALEHLRWAARNAGRVLATRRLRPSLLTLNHATWVHRRPLGVVGVIGPWNYPVYTPMGSIGGALASGNAVVFKPSEHTTGVGAHLVDSFHRAVPEAPDGVLSLVTGDGTSGAALCAAGLDMIAFTGSTGTARLVMTACAATLTPLVLECGGKDAAVVLPDADLRAAARAIAWGGMSNAGQTCVGIERVYVDRTVHDAFVEALRAELDGVRPGSDPGAHYGPMTTAEQADLVRRHVADALARGGRTLDGAKVPGPGRYLDPVVLLGVDEDSLAVAEETFGPTLTVTAVDDVDEAVRRVNGHRYGLAAAVFGGPDAEQVAGRLDVGMVSVNAAVTFAGIPAAPFGGRRDSGFGRVHGADGLRSFTWAQTVARQRFAVPGLDIATLRRSGFTRRAVRFLAGRLNRRPSGPPPD